MTRHVSARGFVVAPVIFVTTRAAAVFVVLGDSFTLYVACSNKICPSETFVPKKLFHPPLLR